MQREPRDTDDRLARLEGQYHALSKELTDGMKELRDRLDEMKATLDDMHVVKGGMLSKDTLGDVVQRIDQSVAEMQKQVVAISNQLQIDQSRIK